MSRFCYIAITAFCGMFSIFSALAQPLIVTTIKPIGLIANDIAGGLANVDVLLPDNASPHHYALRPSDLKKMGKADIIVWVGPEIETFLAKLLTNKANALQLTKYPQMPLRYYGSDEHHHDSDHSDVDGHLWLGPEQSKIIAQAIFQKLIAIDPENKAEYKKNLAKFTQDVTKLQNEIKISFQGKFKQKPYFLFHDAYSYFEQAFDLKPLGHLTINPERKPGARTLAKIHEKFKNQQASCIFSEPQFNPSTINALVKNTQVNVQMLDPMANNLNIENHHYVDFLTQLAKSYQDCFKSNV